MIADCVFCKIIEGKIPSTKVFENEKVLGFKDITPHAPIHYVFIPKTHIESMGKLTKESLPILNDVMAALVETSQKEGLVDSGFRTVINTGKWGGQTVFHLHAHLISGKQLSGGMA